VNLIPMYPIPTSRIPTYLTPVRYRVDLTLQAGRCPRLLLKCPAIGSLVTVTVTVSQPKSALALGGFLIAVALQQAASRPGTRHTAARGNWLRADSCGHLNLDSRKERPNETQKTKVSNARMAASPANFMLSRVA
jgi:hypothetical protein